MSTNTIDWDQDLVISEEESYLSLQNALKRNQDFGLYFVRSSPVKTQTIIEDIKRDLPNKKIGILPLTDEVDNLFNLIANLPDYQNLNILFISGLELSLLRYEERESEGLFLSSQSAVYGGTWAGIPRILGHLNLSRERFREHFPFSIVFCLPEFALRYFIRRAPDFFDWRSGLFTFPEQKEQRIPQLDSRTLKRLEWLGYGCLFLVGLFLSFYLSWLFVSTLMPILGALIGLLISGLGKAIRLRQTQQFAKVDFIILILRGSFATQSNLLGQILLNFGKIKASCVCFERAIEFDPYYHQAWQNRGSALGTLGRYKEAITSFDQALKIKPDLHQVWHYQGLALANLGRIEEAITSYDQALKIKPDYHEAWNIRGIALGNLGRMEEAITSFDNALKIKPDLYGAWNNRGIALGNLGRMEEAIISFDNVLKIKPDVYFAWHNRGNALFRLERYKEAIAAYDNVLKIKPDLYEAWNNRGYAFLKMENHQEAIESIDKALKINPNPHAYESKAYAYILLDKIDLAIENLRYSIEIDPNRKQAILNDSDFDKIRNDRRFIELINQSESQ